MWKDCITEGSQDIIEVVFLCENSGETRQCTHFTLKKHQKHKRKQQKVLVKRVLNQNFLLFSFVLYTTKTTFCPIKTYFL